jgi:hypothetical protein
MEGVISASPPSTRLLTEGFDERGPFVVLVVAVMPLIESKAETEERNSFLVPRFGEPLGTFLKNE